jgi:hypothetical protein
MIVIRPDATLVVSHSDKEQATATFKRTWEHYALTAWCDNTAESFGEPAARGLRRQQHGGRPHPGAVPRDVADPGPLPQPVDHF